VLWLITMKPRRLVLPCASSSLLPAIFPGLGTPLTKRSHREKGHRHRAALVPWQAAETPANSKAMHNLAVLDADGLLQGAPTLTRARRNGSQGRPPAASPTASSTSDPLFSRIGVRTEPRRIPSNGFTSSPSPPRRRRRRLGTQNAMTSAKRLDASRWLAAKLATYIHARRPAR